MAIKRLFVIGNGFDLHHNLPTGFNGFRDYVKKEFPESYDYISKFILKESSEEEKDWNDIENELAETLALNYDEMLEEAILSSEMNMDRASYWSDIQFNAEYYNQELPNLRKAFDEWVDGIEILGVVRPDKEIVFSKEDLFLNFNYTETLQKLYGVEESQIVYIHGRKGTLKVFGHNKTFFEPLPMSRLTQEDYDLGCEDDWRIEEAKAILNGIPKLFLKDSGAIIRNNCKFFDSFKDFEEIVFMGWSLGKQDEIYMKKILSCLSDEARIWVVYYVPENASRYQRYFEEYGGFSQEVMYYPWEEIGAIFKSNRVC